MVWCWLCRRSSVYNAFGTAAAGTSQWPSSLLTSAEVFVYSLGSHMDSGHREGGCVPMAELFFGPGRPREVKTH